MLLSLGCAAVRIVSGGASVGRLVGRLVEEILCHMYLEHGGGGARGGCAGAASSCSGGRWEGRRCIKRPNLVPESTLHSVCVPPQELTHTWGHSS